MTTNSRTTAAAERNNHVDSSVAPFLNDYKQQFLFKRLLQTFFGGLIFKINSESGSAPCYIYLLQIVFFLLPFIFAGTCILITDLADFNRLYMAFIGGAIYLAFIFVLKFTVLIVSNKAYLTKLKKINDFERNQKQKLSRPNAIIASRKLNKLAGAYNDDEEYEFSGFCSISTLNFILPPIGYYVGIEVDDKSSSGNTRTKLNCLKLIALGLRILFDSFLAGLIIFCSIEFLSIKYLITKTNLGLAIFIFIMNWFTTCVTLNSLCIREPPEPAIYQPYDEYSIQHYTRTFYLFCFYLIEMLHNFAPDNANIPSTVIVILKIAIIFLPLLWLLGVLSPIDCFFLWLFEQVYIFLYGGSAAASNLRLMVQLIMSVILSMVHFVPSDLAILIILAIFGYIFSSFDLIYVIECLLMRIKSKRKVSVTDKLSSSSTSTKEESLNQTSNQASSSSSSSQQNLLSENSSTSLLTAKSGTLDKAKTTDKNSKTSVGFKWFDWTFGYFMFILALIASILPFCLTYYLDIPETTKFQAELALLYIGLGLFVLTKILSDIQSVYIFFGLIRNPFYPKNSLSGTNDDTRSKKNKNIHSIKDNRTFFRICRHLRLITIKIVSPLVLCAIISLDCSINRIYNDKIFSYWRIICVLRAFRWIWQSTYACLFEVCLLTNITMFSIWYNVTNDDETKSNLRKYFLTGCLIASFFRDRFIQFLNKFYSFALITITSWTIKKQRRKLALLFTILNFLLFLPFVLTILLVSALLSAPLLPLFTFPFFLIGFPRTKRFWPQKSNFFSFSTNQLKKSDSNTLSKQKTSYFLTPDSSFYKQIAPELIKSFSELIKQGSVGSLFEPDMFYMSRFQDRIIVIQILEVGNTYSIINVKGLELVETSCHTREAQYVDDLFELTFENPDGANANSKKCKSIFNINSHPFNCFRPCDILMFESYSDARNTLIGVLDSQDSQKLICDFFPKILHFFLIKYLLNRSLKRKGSPNQTHAESKSRNVTHDLNSTKTSIILLQSEASYVDNENEKKPKQMSVAERLKRLNDENNDDTSVERPVAEKDHAPTESYDDEKLDAILENLESKSQPKDKSKKKRDSATEYNDDWSEISSIEELSESISSIKPTKSKNKTNKKSKKMNLNSINDREDEEAEQHREELPFEFDLNEILGISSNQEPKKSKKSKNKNNKSLKAESENKKEETIDDDIELFANNLNSIVPNNRLPKIERKEIEMRPISPPKRVTDETSKVKSSRYVDLDEENRPVFKLPTEWVNHLNESFNNSVVSSIKSNELKKFKSTMMQKDWIKKIIDTFKSLNKIKSDFISDLDLNEYEVSLSANHYIFLMKCCHSLNLMEDLILSNLNTVIIHKFFKGELPWSPVNERIAKEFKELHGIIVKSFEYTIKMVIDHITICPVSDDDELLDNLKTLETEWFIGSESDPEFSNSIVNKKQYLFSLFKDPLKKELCSRTLSLQTIRSPMAKLNSEIVKSIWSATNMELLYMTNDDDERYSIQAHQNILRNLTIQSSDAPLGYCIYNSENIYLPLMNPFV